MNQFNFTAKRLEESEIRFLSEKSLGHNKRLFRKGILVYNIKNHQKVIDGFDLEENPEVKKIKAREKFEERQAEAVKIREQENKFRESKENELCLETGYDQRGIYKRSNNWFETTTTIFSE